MWKVSSCNAQCNCIEQNGIEHEALWPNYCVYFAGFCHFFLQTHIPLLVYFIIVRIEMTIQAIDIVSGKMFVQMENWRERTVKSILGNTQLDRNGRSPSAALWYADVNRSTKISWKFCLSINILITHFNCCHQCSRKINSNASYSLLLIRSRVDLWRAVFFEWSSSFRVPYVCSVQNPLYPKFTSKNRSTVWIWSNFSLRLNFNALSTQILDYVPNLHAILKIVPLSL